MKSKQVILPHQNCRFQYYENETFENYWERIKKLPQSTWTFPLKFNQHGYVPIECLDSKKISLTEKKLYPDLFVREQARIILPLLSLLPSLPQGGGIAVWDEPVQTPRISPCRCCGAQVEEWDGAQEWFVRVKYVLHMKINKTSKGREALESNRKK